MPSSLERRRKNSPRNGLPLPHGQWTILWKNSSEHSRVTFRAGRKNTTSTSGGRCKTRYATNDLLCLWKATRSYGKGDKLYVIENVPIVACPNCGESYLTAETLHEIERLKLHRKKLAQERCIDVVVFA
ncbi:MAG: type II toxin-antitoxin system MqsA family antitoxin [Chloroflexi bacterium]|nr:type II toxin-antitoxin system MqsA family antitoxin [Chloroflexota bacterium]